MILAIVSVAGTTLPEWGNEGGKTSAMIPTVPTFKLDSPQIQASKGI
jgi:hypothetical protein